jgi:hypothetical protein
LDVGELGCKVAKNQGRTWAGKAGKIATYSVIGTLFALVFAIVCRAAGFTASAPALLVVFLVGSSTAVLATWIWGRLRRAKG